MSDPTRYAWCPHGMRPSTVEFGTIRYINQHDHDRLVAVLRRERDAAREQVAELTAERDSETLGTLGIVISTLRAERDAARAKLMAMTVWLERGCGTPSTPR